LALADHAAIYLSNLPCNVSSRRMIGRAALSKNNNALLYMVLHSDGVYLAPVGYPAGRWALTPPFHPCPAKPDGLISVTLSVARGLPPYTPGCCLPGHPALECSDFPQCFSTAAAYSFPQKLTKIHYFTFLSIARFASLSAFLFFDLSICETVYGILSFFIIT